MQQALIVGRQVILIFIYVGIGMIATKKGVLDEKTGRGLSNLCLNIIIPALVIHYFIRPFDAREAQGLALGFGLALFFHAMAVFFVIPILRKSEGDGYRIERLAVIFSNCGFMGIPLIRAATGEDGVFFVLGFIVVYTIFIWSLGVMVLTGQSRMDVRQIVLNPGVIATLIGLIIYITGLPVPSILAQAVDGLMSFLTPLSMMTVGIFLAAVKVKSVFTNPRLYMVTFLRLIALPMIMLLLMKALGVEHWIPAAPAVIVSIGLGCACPCASATTLLPAKHGMRGDYGAEMIAVTTLLSVITLPLITLIIGAMF